MKNVNFVDMIQDTYLSVSAPAEGLFKDNGSRFISYAYPVETEEEARAFLNEIRRKYHDARHNCWCYRIHGGPERFSDDGEPQGSAGMPMLEVFRKENVENCVCVVTRYFGGVLLGTGGLSRAYSQAATGCWIVIKMSLQASERYWENLITLPKC